MFFFFAFSLYSILLLKTAISREPVQKRIFNSAWLPCDRNSTIFFSLAPLIYIFFSSSFVVFFFWLAFSFAEKLLIEIYAKRNSFVDLHSSFILFFKPAFCVYVTLFFLPISFLPSNAIEVEGRKKKNERRIKIDRRVIWILKQGIRHYKCLNIHSDYNLRRVIIKSHIRSSFRSFVCSFVRWIGVTANILYAW